MVDIPLGGFRDDGFVRSQRKLISFPNVTDGGLADAIARLSAPGTEQELRSEAQFRRMYRSAAGSWPVARARARRNRLSILVGAASVASVFATATGLSAASVLPSPASHVVNSILGPLNGENGSPATPPATQPLESGGAATAPGGTAASVVSGSAVAAGAQFGRRQHRLSARERPLYGASRAFRPGRSDGRGHRRRKPSRRLGLWVDPERHQHPDDRFCVPAGWCDLGQRRQPDRNLRLDSRHRAGRGLDIG